jgi:hypothetical protein
LAEDGDGRFGGCEGIALPGDGLNEGGFAATVGAENGYMFPRPDAEADVTEGDVFAAHYGDAAQFD